MNLRMEDIDMFNMEHIEEFRSNYYFLSNMYPCEIKYNGRVFTCVENFFQCMKCENIEDMNKFRGLNGFESKKLGRRIKMRADWDKVRINVMRTGLYLKFKSCDELKYKLKGTEGYYLVEGNNHGDIFWGKDNSNGFGRNMLGELLMEVRKNI